MKKQLKSFFKKIKCYLFKGVDQSLMTDRQCFVGMLNHLQKKGYGFECRQDGDLVFIDMTKRVAFDKKVSSPVAMIPMKNN